MKKLLLFTAAAAAAAVCFGAPLEIPAEPCFNAPPPFPKAQFPAGRLHKPLAPEWKEFILDLKWKRTEVPFVQGAKKLDDKGIQEKFYAENFNDSSWNDVELFTVKDISSYWRSQNVIYYYRKTVDLPRKAAGTQYVLDFRRVGSRADVWVNGKSAGPFHFGRDNAFQYDITSLLRSGKNQITVRTYNGFHTRGVLNGISDTVRLYAVKGSASVNYAAFLPDLKNSTVDVKAHFIGKPFKGLSLELYNAEGKKIVSKKYPDFQADPNKSWLTIDTAFKIPNVRCWSPDNPYLYFMKFKDAKGNVVGYEQFGFREFTVKGEWFYLNGKKFKPRAFTFNAWTRQFSLNENSCMELLLRLYKVMNINMIRPHSGERQHFESMRYLCDRVGILLYVDWSGSFTGGIEEVGFPKSLKYVQPNLNDFIDRSYTNPCFVMLSFGNEMYEGQNGHFHSAALQKMYTATKDHDMTKRPICTSTGRQTYEALTAGLLKEQTDVADDHQYRGSYCGSWQENIDHIKNVAAATRKRYGMIPKIDSEYGVPGDCARFRSVSNRVVGPVVFDQNRSNAAFKARYAKMLQSPVAEIGHYLRLKSNYCTPEDYANRKPMYELFARRYYKRPAEIYRRAGVDCLGGHVNAQFYDTIHFWPEIWWHHNEGHHIDISQYKVLPLFYELKRTYNPTLVSAGIFNTYPYAGETIKIPVYVTNDLNSEASFSVKVQFRPEEKGAKVLEFPMMEFGNIGEMEQKMMEFTFKIPAVKKIQRGNVEFYLFRNGKRVGDNFYDMAFFPKRKVTLPAKLALYDSAGIRFRGLTKTPTTISMLKRFGGKFTTIRDFSKLNEFTHLILGVNAFDLCVMENGDKLLEWVRNGGKLLVLEQSFCGKVPFLSHYSIVSGNAGTFVTIVDMKHPVFNTIRQRELDSWFGGIQGRMSQYAIAPLDGGMVAISPLAAFGDCDSYKSVLCDAKIGKGEIILSQIDTNSRMKECGAAGEYFVSLLEYFGRKDVPQYAVEIKAKADKVTYMDEKDAFYVDLSKHVNRSFTDDISGDKKGGWADFGGANDFREIPCGKITRLQGGVPFKIINPKRNNDNSCIVLQGKIRPYFPTEVKGIPVNAVLNSIFVLHTSMYAPRNGGISAQYVIHYEDGTSHTFNADARFDLPDWWQGVAARNATPVFRAGSKTLFLSEFINPSPNKKIVSMDIIGGKQAVPIVIAITGRLRLTSVVSGVGEK